MEDFNKDYVYLDGMRVREEQLIRLAMNAGSFGVAEHYLCALLANAVIFGRREVIKKVNEVREFYHVPQIPLPGDFDDEQSTNGYHGVSCTLDDQARFIYQKKRLYQRLDILRESLEELQANYNLFKNKRHWLAIYLVMRDRLEGENFRMKGFADYAEQLTPDNWPERLFCSESTAKNFSREIDPRDKGEAYYDMKYNPQRELCETYWNIVKRRLLTEE